MTEITVPRCIAPNCEIPAAPNSPLCATHKERLQKIEEEILRGATCRIRAEMRQFERLILIEPPLHSVEIANRMVWPVKEVKRMLKKFRDDRA